MLGESEENAKSEESGGNSEVEWDEERGLEEGCFQGGRNSEWSGNDEWSVDGKWSGDDEEGGQEVN